MPVFTAVTGSEIGRQVPFKKKMYLKKRRCTESPIIRYVLQDCDIYFPKFLKNTGLW